MIEEALIGLTLREARAVLQGVENPQGREGWDGWETWDEPPPGTFAAAALSHLPVRLVETAPPPRPAPRHGAANRDTRQEPRQSEARQSEPHWGEWRVLRCRVETEQGQPRGVELLVAREELRS